MAASLAIVLPILQPLLELPEHGSVDAAVADLLHAGSFTSHDPCLVGCTYTLSQLEDPSDYPGVESHWKRSDKYRVHSTLVIEIMDEGFVAAFRSDFQRSNPNTSAEMLEEAIATYAVHNVATEVNALLLLANILRPGSLSSYEGIALFQGEVVATTASFYAEEWSRAVAASEKYKWPTFLRLSAKSAWDWLRMVGCFVDGIAHGKTGRALAALSCIAPPEPEAGSMNLAWIMLGLEALYASGNVALKEQLVGNSELVLGPRTENKKAFGQMYDFRSRLLHGDVDLPLRYSTFDAVPYFEQHIHELGDYEGLGLATLCATVQVMIAQGWRELRFHRTFTPVSTQSGEGAA